MGQITARAAAILDAQPTDIYTTIADYQHGHPNILPKESFYNLTVEQGGYGAGTVIRFTMKALGTELLFYQRVSEPEPGRVLVEQDIDSQQHVVTTFIVTPVEHEKARVEITTTMNTSPGIKGLMERIIVPILNSRVYRKELKLLRHSPRKKPRLQFEKG